MTDVIFKEEEHNADSVSIQIYKNLQDFLNSLQQEALKHLVRYHEEKGRSPTNGELAKFSGIKYENLQPRISELEEQHIVESDGKRPCKFADHNRSVNTWKPTREVTR